MIDAAFPIALSLQWQPIDASNGMLLSACMPLPSPFPSWRSVVLQYLRCRLSMGQIDFFTATHLRPWSS